MSEQHKRLRVVSGMRPTGRLHLGHLYGALVNWLDLAGTHDCFFFSADWHALTTHYADPRVMKQAERDMFVDWLALGLDPAKCTLFIQSDVKEHAELALLLGMITPVSWLERVPTYKEQQQNLTDRDLSCIGFLNYPVLQTADVAVYGANAVPVGQDQVSHLEVSREIVRRFNNFYGTPEKPVLVEPQPLLTKNAKIRGTDGRKMSKSFGNAIELGEDVGSATKKIMAAKTDEQRKRRTDPGNPENCGIFDLHVALSPAETVANVDRECRVAGIGCVDCKKQLLVSLAPALEKHRKAREELEKTPERIDAAIKAGATRAREEAAKTMGAVRAAMNVG